MVGDLSQVSIPCVMDKLRLAAENPDNFSVYKPTTAMSLTKGSRSLMLHREQGSFCYDSPKKLPIAASKPFVGDLAERHL